MFFFDSHGAMHQTCDADHPEAAAFGPTGVSRPVVGEELEAVLPGWAASGSPWAHAALMGRRQVNSDGFDRLR